MIERTLYSLLIYSCLVTGSESDVAVCKSVSLSEVEEIDLEDDCNVFIENNPVLKGQKGEIGPEGKSGSKGDLGLKGDLGPEGKNGSKGETGLTGDTGPKGETGRKGEIGNKGLKGENGTKGESGLKGEIGSKGENGTKGEKGNEGTFNQTELIKLKTELQEIKARMKSISIWDELLNIGYEYRFTLFFQSWQDSRRICQGWGGDLAVNGIKTHSNRSALKQFWNIQEIIWVGVEEIQDEGKWVFLNKEVVPSNSSLWNPGQPVASANKDCAFIDFDKGTGLQSGSCSEPMLGFCERQIEQ